MKRFLAACLALVIATPAFAGGVYTNATTTETTAWSVNVPSGSVSAGNRFGVDAEFEAACLASFVFNGVNVLIDPWLLEGQQPIVRLDVWRTGNTTALVRPWFGNGGGGEALVPGGRFVVSGLNWNTGQTFTITTAGGCVIERAGIAR